MKNHAAIEAHARRIYEATMREYDIPEFAWWAHLSMLEVEARDDVRRARVAAVDAIEASGLSKSAALRFLPFSRYAYYKWRDELAERD